MATVVSGDSPWMRRFGAWADERFPPAQGVLVLAMYGAAALLGSFLAGDGALAVSPRHVPGFFAVWAFFLMLRVFDEHKDYRKDCHDHPERVLQRGLITLDQLKLVAAGAIALQLGASLWHDGGWGPVTVLWLVVMAWSTLMACEFFCGTWLEKQLVLYATSHMLVMPLAALWMSQFGAGSTRLASSPAAWIFCAQAFLAGASFELTRKTKGPEEERAEIDSYSRIFGTRGAPLGIAAFLIALTGAELALLRIVRGGLGGWPAVLVLVALGYALTALQRFRRTPSAAGRKRNETAVGLCTLLGYIALIAALILERGVAWQ